MTSARLKHVALPASPTAEAFYVDSLKLLKRSRIPFMIAGTYAVSAYTGITRPTKDIDVFCRAGDFPRIMKLFQEKGYEIEIADPRWLAKVKKGKHFFDVIFNSKTAATPIGDHWFHETHTAHIHGIKVQIVAPTELVWSKVFIQDRTRYDGADIAHLILKQSAAIDWKRLLSYMEHYWEVLLIHLLNFRFIYPTERQCVPDWLFDELMDRVKNQAQMPKPQRSVCRGRIFSPDDYLVDIAEWGYGDIVG